MTTLITGGSGLIGTAIANRLAARGEPVISFDIDPVDDAEDGVEPVAGDVAAYRTLATAVEEYSVDRIAHTAAIIGTDSTHRAPTRALQVNGVGTDNVFRAGDEYDLERVLWTSSIGVYGPPDLYRGDPVSESTAPPAAYAVYDGSSLYRALKQLNDLQGRLYNEEKQVAAYGVRPSVVFGPRRDSGWIGRFIEDAVNTGESTIERPPDDTISFVYVTDVATLYVELLFAESPAHSVYNTGGTAISARELADIVERETGATVRCDDEAPPNPSPAVVENDRATSEFDYSVRPMRDAVRDYIRTIDDGDT